MATRRWFVRTGALVQELVAPRRFDLRLIVAGGRVVGSVQRVAGVGDWRTNVSLGGRLVPMTAEPSARSLGVPAAAAVGADLVGIDTLPGERGWIVLELNGAVNFNAVYSAPGHDAFADAAEALGPLPVAHERRSA